MAHGNTTLDRQRIEQLVREVLRDQLGGAGGASTSAQPAASTSTSGGGGGGGGPSPLVINVSARHIHVTDSDLEILFGPGAKLTRLRDLYQDGEFASEQLVNVIGPRNRMIPSVRILGPTRKYTQVELSYTDGIFLGIDLPVRISGNHDHTPGCILVGPHGALNLRQGVIRAERHVHMHPTDAERYGVADGDQMKLHIEGPCGLTFDRVRVRVDKRVKLEVHIDTDEGNACHLPTATRIELIK